MRQSLPCASGANAIVDPCVSKKSRNALKRFAMNLSHWFVEKRLEPIFVVGVLKSTCVSSRSRNALKRPVVFPSPEKGEAPHKLSAFRAPRQNPMLQVFGGALLCLCWAASHPRIAFGFRTMSDRQDDTDVLVVGGGTAGFGAAVAAGRQGLRATLLETTSKVGGVMASCPGMPWGRAYPVDRIVGGLIGELTERLKRPVVFPSPEKGEAPHKLSAFRAPRQKPVPQVFGVTL